MEQFSSLFDDPPEHYFWFSQYAEAFHRDFLKTIPARAESQPIMAPMMMEMSGDPSSAFGDRSNPHFPRDINELIDRLTSWKVFLESIIKHTSDASLPVIGFSSLSSILPFLKVPSCFSDKLATPRMQSISYFSPSLNDAGFRWNSFRIKDDFGSFHYFSLVKERPMDLIFSLSAGLLIQFFCRLFQNNPNMVKRMQLSYRYNMLPLNAVTMIVERAKNEFSVSEMMQSILKKKGVDLDEFLIAIAEARRLNAEAMSPSELDASLPMTGEVREYL